MPAHILFVGRQPDLYAPLWRHLSVTGVEVAFAASLARAARELVETPFEVIVLDSASFRAAAEPLCRTLRQQAPAARLILIADTPALSSICYDFQLIQPVSWTDLAETLSVALRSERRQVLSEGLFVLDLETQTIIGPAGEARLTPKLFELLRLFMSHPNELVQRPTIMQEVWHTTYLEDTRTLDVHISWLRGIIEPEPKRPQHLLTKRGAGYVFRPERKSAAAEAETEQESAAAL